MNRRNFLGKFILWLLSVFFGYQMGSKSILGDEDEKENSRPEQLQLLNKRLESIENSTIHINSFPRRASEKDDTLRIQRALSKLRETGGTIEFPSGSFQVKEIDLTQQSKKTITLKGKGIGVTIINCSSNGIIINSYLTRIQDLELVGSKKGAGINVLSRSSNGDDVPGRTWIEYVQVTNFKYGIEANHFDQFWINNCNLGRNESCGIYIHPATGAALLHISDTITNDNGEHGLHIYSSGIMSHVTITNHEAISNGKNGMRIEGVKTNSLLSVHLDNIDIEGVSSKSNNNVALYMKNTWKFNIRGGQYSAKPGSSIFSAIQLDSCKSGVIMHPWFRSDQDGMGKANHFIYISNGADQIYLIASQYFGVPVDFAYDTKTDKSSLVSIDNFVKQQKKQFIAGEHFFKMKGNPSFKTVGNFQAWLYESKSTQSAGTSFMATDEIKKVTILWFSQVNGEGRVDWQLGFKKISEQESMMASFEHENKVAVVKEEKHILKKTSITPMKSNSPGELIALEVIRNTAGSQDTLQGQVGLIGVEVEFK